MYFKRAAALIGALALSFIAAGCSGGGGGATPPLPVTPQTDTGVGNTADSTVGMGSGNLQTLSTTTNTESATITGALKTRELYGPIVALKTGGFQMHAQSGIGYVNVYPTSSTHKFYNGLNPAVNEYAIVTANGNVATSPSPVMIALYKTAPGTVTVTGAITSQQPYGVAIKLDSNGSYIPVAFSSISNLSGPVATGAHISATGTGTSGVLFATTVKVTSSSTTSSTSTSTSTTTTPTTDATTATSGVPKHVLTTTVFWGYGGTPTTVSASSAAPYLSWAQTGSSYIKTLQSYGIKVDRYVNFWRNYTSDYSQTLYKDIAPGGAHYPAAAKSCSGTALKDPTYGGGYETDARSSYALGHAKLAGGLNGANALFADDTGAMGGMPLPCNWSLSSYQSAVSSLFSGLGVPMFINALGAGSSVVGQVGYANASNVIGAMCELCITKNGSTDTPVLNGGWTDTENAEIKMVNEHKIFWLYARASGSYSEYRLRNYTIASFLLAYSPSYAMLQEAYQTGHRFPIFPETGLVPMNPVTTASSVSGYMKSNGTYMREFGACYYRGVLKGKCAVVVNPTSYSKSLPTTAYGHAMTLSGSGVLDGGTVGFGGGRPSSLPSGSGVVLFP